LLVLERTWLFCPYSGAFVSGWWLYLFEKNARFYVGITTSIGKRLRQHGNPESLYEEGPYERIEAANREKQCHGAAQITLIVKGC
jgi:hypothetical protein